MTHTNTEHSGTGISETDSPTMPDADALADFISAGVSIVCPRPELGALRQVAEIAAALGLPPSTEIPDGAWVGTSNADTVGKPPPTVTTVADLNAWLKLHHADPDTTPLLHSDDFSIEVGILGIEGTTCGAHTYNRRALLIYTDPECLMFCVSPGSGAAAVADRLEHFTSKRGGGATLADALAQLRDESYPDSALVDGVIAFCRDHPSSVATQTDPRESS